MNLSDSEVIYMYQGELNNAVISGIMGQMEKKLLEGGESRAVVRKLNSVLIECCQNLIHHSEQSLGEHTGEDPNARAPRVEVRRAAEGYIVSSTNVVQLDTAAKLETYLGRINSMSRPELRAYYHEVLTNGAISEKGGGGLGMLNMACKAKDSRVYFEFQPLNKDELYFQMSILV